MPDPQLDAADRGARARPARDNSRPREEEATETRPSPPDRPGEAPGLAADPRPDPAPPVPEAGPPSGIQADALGLSPGGLNPTGLNATGVTLSGADGLGKTGGDPVQTASPAAAKPRSGAARDLAGGVGPGDNPDNSDNPDDLSPAAAVPVLTMTVPDPAPPPPLASPAATVAGEGGASRPAGPAAARLPPIPHRPGPGSGLGSAPGPGPGPGAAGEPDRAGAPFSGFSVSGMADMAPPPDSLPPAAGHAAPVPELAAAPPRAEPPPAAAPPAASPLGRPPPPAEQIGAALVATATAPGGTQTVTVQLHPEDLGEVRIRIDRAIGGFAHVAISAARPETLRLLREDEPGLRRVLDDAGLPPEGRTVSFDVPPPQPVAPHARFDVLSTGSGGAGQGGQHMAGGGRNGDTASGRGQDPAQDPVADRDSPRGRWARAGLDIVA